MNIVIVDNNANDLSLVVNEIATIFPEMQTQTFTDPLMSAKYICNNKVDVAFLSASMRPVDGLILLRSLRANKPELPIIIMLDNEPLREAELCAPANGYLVKPIITKQLKSTLEQILFSQSAG